MNEWTGVLALDVWQGCVVLDDDVWLLGLGARLT
jgi:hypothetical protein